jgi:hypothetical protein
MKNVTQNWETPDVAPPPGAGSAATPTPAPTGPAPAGGPARPSPEDLVNKNKGKK